MITFYAQKMYIHINVVPEFASYIYISCLILSYIPNLSLTAYTEYGGSKFLHKVSNYN
jgi:hypothetical protein